MWHLFKFSGCFGQFSNAKASRATLLQEGGAGVLFNRANRSHDELRFDLVVLLARTRNVEWTSRVFDDTTLELRAKHIHLGDLAEDHWGSRVAYDATSRQLGSVVHSSEMVVYVEGRRLDLGGALGRRTGCHLVKRCINRNVCDAKLVDVRRAAQI